MYIGPEDFITYFARADNMLLPFTRGQITCYCPRKMLLPRRQITRRKFGSCRYILSLGCSERMEFLEQLRIQYETWDVRCDEKSIWRKNIASIVCLLRIWQRKINDNIFVSRLMLDNMYYHIFYYKVMTFGLIKKEIFQNSQFLNDDWLIVVCLLFNAHRQIFRAFSWLVKVQQYLESNLQECRVIGDGSQGSTHKAVVRRKQL
jgi:hypothetical protein